MLKRRLVSFLCTLALVFSCMNGTVFALANTLLQLKLTANTDIALVGSELEVNGSFGNLAEGQHAGVVVMQFDLTYDTSAFTYVGIRLKDGVKGTILGYEGAPGVISVVYDCEMMDGEPIPLPESTTDLFTADFTVKQDAANKDYTFTYANVSVWDKNEIAIDVNRTAATVFVMDSLPSELGLSLLASENVQMGEKFTVEHRLSGADDFANPVVIMQFDMDYNTALMKLTGITPKDDINGTLTWHEAQPGHVVVLYDSHNIEGLPVTASGLFTAAFDAKLSGVVGETSMTISNVLVLDTEETVLNNSVRNAVFAVNNDTIPALQALIAELPEVTKENVVQVQETVQQIRAMLSRLTTEGTAAVDTARVAEIEAQIKAINAPNKNILGYILEKADEQVASGALDQVIPLVAERYRAALDKARQVFLNEDATQVEVDIAAQKMLEMMGYLSFLKADKTDLNQVMNLAEKIDLNNYLAVGQETFSKALQEAHAVLGDENAMQDEVTQAWRTLLRTMADLRIKPSKAALELLKKQAEAIDLSLYTQESGLSLKQAVAQAGAVLANDQATQDQVDKAQQALNQAMSNLVLLMDEGTDAPVAGTGTNNAGSASNTKTGDTMPVALLFVISAMSGLAVFGLKKRKNQ